MCEAICYREAVFGSRFGLALGNAFADFWADSLLLRNHCGVVNTVPGSSVNPVEAETLSKIEVLSDLEPLVNELMASHEAKRVLWFPAELLEPPPGEDPDRHLKALREREAAAKV